jgi:hypothetical protein
MPMNTITLMGKRHYLPKKRATLFGNENGYAKLARVPHDLHYFLTCSAR